jgi:hypothetical protein
LLARGSSVAGKKYAGCQAETATTDRRCSSNSGPFSAGKPDQSSVKNSQAPDAL